MTEERPEPIGEALERLSRTLDANPGPAPSKADVWALAAGELSPDRAAAVMREVTGDGDALRELAVAELALVDAEAAPQHAREAAARAALAAARAPARPSWVLRAASFALVAAAVVVAFLWWRGAETTAPSWQANVASISRLRGDDPELVRVQFRVEVELRGETRLALVTVGHPAQGPVRATLQLPAAPAVQSRPEFAGWSDGRVARGRHMFPPPGVGAYEIEVRGRAAVFLLWAPADAPLDHAAAQALAATIMAECQPAVTADGLDRAVRALEARGMHAEWRRLH
jgi:hypothetical protein